MSRSDDLAGFVALARRRGVQRLEVEIDGLALTFDRSRDPPSSSVVVKAGAFGHFVSACPGSERPLAAPGDAVAEGDLVGLLRIGSLYRPVRTPVAGTVRGFRAADGMLVGHGEPVIEIEPHGDGEAAC